MATTTAEIITMPKPVSAQMAEQAILNLFAAHKNMCAAASGAEDDVLWNLLTEIENQIARYPATTAAALAVKFVIGYEYNPHVPIRASLDADLVKLIGMNLSDWKN